VRFGLPVHKEMHVYFTTLQSLANFGLAAVSEINVYIFIRKCAANLLMLAPIPNVHILTLQRLRTEEGVGLVVFVAPAREADF